MEHSVLREDSAASTGSQTPNGGKWGEENKMWSQQGEMCWTQVKQMERQGDVDLGSREQPGRHMEMNQSWIGPTNSASASPSLPRCCSHLQLYLSGCLHQLHRRSPPWPAGSTWRISCSCPGCWSAASAASPRLPGTAAAPRPTAPRWPRRSAWSLQGGGTEPSAAGKPTGQSAQGGQEGLVRPRKEAEEQVADGPEQHPAVRALIPAWTRSFRAARGAGPGQREFQADLALLRVIKPA